MPIQIWRRAVTYRCMVHCWRPGEIRRTSAGLASAMHMPSSSVAVTKAAVGGKPSKLILDWELGVPISAKQRMCRENHVPFCDHQGKQTNIDATVPLDAP